MSSLRALVVAAAAAAVIGLGGCGGTGGAGVPPASSRPLRPAPSGTKAPTVAPSWKVLPGWRTETIAFPLEFAPGLPYAGVEELRFPPQFFERGDEQYFTYAFVWLILAPGPADVEALEGDLVSYFAGLARAVGGADRADIQAADYRAELVGDLGGDVHGTVTAFDAFKAQAPVTLHLRARRVLCMQAGVIAIIFAASPRALSHEDPRWRELDALADVFRC